MENLGRRSVVNILLVLGAMAALLFGVAGSFDWWQAWVLLAVFGILSALITGWLWKYDKALLERRMKGGPQAETEPAQKAIMSFAVIGFLLLLVVPALDHRFGWSQVPTWVILLGNTLVILGYYVIFRVFKENTFTAATVEIHEGQKVVSTGPYAWLRHPMYFGGAIFLLGLPLAFGSYWALLVFVPFLPVLVWRLLDEERLLAANLSGYKEYMQKVRYRLIPFVW